MHRLNIRNPETRALVWPVLRTYRADGSRVALICRSPLRHRSESGSSLVGLSAGSPTDLGGSPLFSSAIMGLVGGRYSSTVLGGDSSRTDVCDLAKIRSSAGVRSSVSFARSTDIPLRLIDELHRREPGRSIRRGLRCPKRTAFHHRYHERTSARSPFFRSCSASAKQKSLAYRIR